MAPGESRLLGVGVIVPTIIGVPRGPISTKRLILTIAIILCGYDLMTTNATFVDPFNKSRDMQSSSQYSSSVVQPSYLSLILQRIHFGPLLNLRKITNRSPRQQQFASNRPKPQKKKALNYLSRFYPVLQPREPVGPDTIRSISPRRRVSFSHSGEMVSYPVGRVTRPIMRLRWGK